MADAGSALTFGSRQYARKALGQDFTFGDPNESSMRDLIRQRGTSATHASDLTIDPAYQGVKVRQLPTGGLNTGGPIGPTAYTSTTGKDYQSNSRTTTHTDRNLTRRVKSNLANFRPMADVVQDALATAGVIQKRS